MLDERIRDDFRYEVWVTYFPERSEWSFCQVDMTGFRNLRVRKHTIRAPQARHPSPIGSRPKDLAHCWDRLEDMLVFFREAFTPPVKVYLLEGGDDPILLGRGDYLATTLRYHRRICEGYGIVLPVDLYERVPEELSRAAEDFPYTAQRRSKKGGRDSLAKRIEGLEL